MWKRSVRPSWLSTTWNQPSAGNASSGAAATTPFNATTPSAATSVCRSRRSCQATNAQTAASASTFVSRIEVAQTSSDGASAHCSADSLRKQSAIAAKVTRGTANASVRTWVKVQIAGRSISVSATTRKAPAPPATRRANHAMPATPARFTHSENARPTAIDVPKSAPAAP